MISYVNYYPIKDLNQIFFLVRQYQPTLQKKYILSKLFLFINFHFLLSIPVSDKVLTNFETF
jgi:hypothetical protein